MLDPSVIDALVVSGCSCEQLAAAVKADAIATQQKEHERVLARRALGRARTRVYREKLKQNQQPCDASDASQALHPSPLLSPLDKKERTKEKINPPYYPPTPLKHKLLKIEFEKLWPLFPRKVGKGNAMKAFCKARTKTSLEIIHGGLVAYVKFKPPWQEWCHFSTWLNQERWNDQHEVSTVIPFIAKPKTAGELQREAIDALRTFAAGGQDKSASCGALAQPAYGFVSSGSDPGDIFGTSKGDDYDFYSISRKHIEGDSEPSFWDAKRL